MMKLKTICCVALAVAASGCLAPQVHAQDVSPIGDAITNAFFNQSGDIYRNRGIDRQATLLFGLSFSEHEYFNDALAVNKIYQDGIRQRIDTPINTADLPNPYTTSIRTNLLQSGATSN